MSSKRIYIGPTSEGIDLDKLVPTGFEIHPPARRGSMEDCIGNTSTIVLVDGVFHSEPSVGHAEIRECIQNGIQVYGCSSMGAIRAFEMRKLGMIGFGLVYENFCERGQDFTDDEVTQIHLNKESSYASLSEPLVNLRHFINFRFASSGGNQEKARELIHKFKQLYFGDRTLERYVRALSNLLDETPDEITRDFKRQRVKQRDFVDLINWISENAHT